MEENKVTLTLSEYLKLYDSKKEIENTVKEIIDYLFIKGFEINDNGELEFERYNLSNEKMKALLEKYDKERVENIYKALKEE